MFYTTKEIIGNCQKMNRLTLIFLSDIGVQQLAAA
jgi:hypothetical protein